MDKQQLTGWFPGHIKPVRPGVYRRRFADGGRLYARWDGLFWRIAHTKPEAAAKEVSRSPIQSSPDWRGVAKPTKECRHG